MIAASLAGCGGDGGQPARPARPAPQVRPALPALPALPVLQEEPAPSSVGSNALTNPDAITTNAQAWANLQPTVTITSVTIASPPVVSFTVVDSFGKAVVGLGNTSKSATAMVASYPNLSFAHRQARSGRRRRAEQVGELHRHHGAELGHGRRRRRPPEHRQHRHAGRQRRRQLHSTPSTATSRQDILEPDCLFTVASAVHRDPLLDLLVWDDDVRDAGGHRSGPRFRPSWSPEMLLGADYIGTACAIRRTAWQAVGGLDRGSAPSALWGLLLALDVSDEKVFRSSRVLSSVSRRPSPDPATAAKMVSTTSTPAGWRRRPSWSTRWCG